MFDYTNLRNDIGWEGVQVSFEEGIRRTKVWLEEQNNTALEGFR